MDMSEMRPYRASHPGIFGQKQCGNAFRSEKWTEALKRGEQTALNALDSPARLFIFGK